MKLVFKPCYFLITLFFGATLFANTTEPSEIYCYGGGTISDSSPHKFAKEEAITKCGWEENSKVHMLHCHRPLPGKLGVDNAVPLNDPKYVCGKAEIFGENKKAVFHCNHGNGWQLSSGKKPVCPQDG